MNPYYRIRHFGDVSNLLRDYVMDQAREHLTRATVRKAALTTPEQVRAYQAELRAAFCRAIGGLPPRPASLTPVWGPRRERGQYTVQNLLVAAGGGSYLTATVWRPVGWPGRRPAILFPCGHHEYPREAAEYQEVCAWFAVNGYVTLGFDPPGQGEQKLCWDPTLGASFAGSGSAEHEHCGLQCELVGHNIARYFVHLGMVAVDVLVSLPEVDPARLAVTGNSGGGTQSSYLMLADERLAAAMPCTFTTDRWEYMRRPHWHDEEQALTGSIPAGPDYDDFYIGFAPKPAAIGAVQWDFFPVEGTRLAFERARQVYSRFGAADRLALFVEVGPHAYLPALRRAAIEFFNRFLQPEAGFRLPANFQPEPVELQRNTASGQLSTSVPEARLVFEQNCEAVVESRRARHPPTAAELSARLGLPTHACPLHPRVLDTHDEQGLTIRKSFIMTEPGIAVPVLRLSAASTPATAALVYVGDGGIQGLDGPTESLLRALARLGLSVYLLEPRGIGETAPRPGEPGEVSILAEKWIPQHLRMLGTSLGALRAFDLTRGFELVRSETPGVPVMLMSHGFVGWAASLAAALDGQITHLCLDELRPSLEEFATTRTAKVPQAYAMPGILQLADVPELLQAARPHHVLILEPRDALGTPVAEAAWQRRYAPGWHRLELAPQVRCDLDSLKRHAALVDFFAQPPQG